jgi:gamma-glutamyltranspeptidase/glutathione hydrolase
MFLRGRWFPNKEEVVADNGIVASKHPLAAEAGLEILKQGGNAIDAAVATGFAICVVEPLMCCIAGVGYMVIHLAEQGENIAIEYPPRAPKTASSDMYKILDPSGVGISIYETEGQEQILGYKSIAVPGTVSGLCLAHKMFGKLPLATVLEPAIALAEEGYEVNWHLALSISNSMEELQRFDATAAIFLPNGRPPKSIQDKLVQRDLGQVLRAIAKNGPEAFYTGEIAIAIEEDMKRNGGLITRDDLASYQAVARPPRSIRYRDYEVLSPDIHHGGTTLLQTLNVLKHFNLKAVGHNSSEYLHLFIEAARHAFADRYSYLGDPEYVSVPIDGILSDDYAKSLASLIDSKLGLPPESWKAMLEYPRETEPWVYYSSQAIHDPWEYDSHLRPKDSIQISQSPYITNNDCTTHFGVVDKDRNLVSCTQTAVGAFGSKVVTPGLGVLWNNGMVWLNPKPGSANSIQPWKRPLTNMAPILALKNGKPALSIGSPGGRYIMNCNTQVFLNAADFGMGIQQSIAQPRIDVSGNTTLVDERIDTKTVEELRKMGHQVSIVQETAASGNFATPIGILIDHDTGKVHGGVDVFRIAEARGY